MQLTGGFTTNIVQLEGGFVTKTGKTASDEAAWYAAYQDKNDIPKVIESNHLSLKMEFIQETSELFPKSNYFFYNNELCARATLYPGRSFEEIDELLKRKWFPSRVNLDQVIELVEKYKAYQWLNKLTFTAYYERILYHVEQSEISNGHKILDALKPIKLEPTFAHGDLSVRNIIQTDTGPKLIDPLYFWNFGSYILDYAKLAFTLKFFNGDMEGFEKIKSVANVPYFDVLVAAECMRVSTYNHKFDFICENLLNEL